MHAICCSGYRLNLLEAKHQALYLAMYADASRDICSSSSSGSRPHHRHHQLRASNCELPKALREHMLCALRATVLLEL